MRLLQKAKEQCEETIAANFGRNGRIIAQFVVFSRSPRSNEYIHLVADKASDRRRVVETSNVERRTSNAETNGKDGRRSKDRELAKQLDKRSEYDTSVPDADTSSEFPDHLNKSLTVVAVGDESKDATPLEPSSQQTFPLFSAKRWENSPLGAFGVGIIHSLSKLVGVKSEAEKRYECVQKLADNLTKDGYRCVAFAGDVQQATKGIDWDVDRFVEASKTKEIVVLFDSLGSDIDIGNDLGQYFKELGESGITLVALIVGSCDSAATPGFTNCSVRFMDKKASVTGHVCSSEEGLNQFDMDKAKKDCALSDKTTLLLYEAGLGSEAAGKLLGVTKNKEGKLLGDGKDAAACLKLGIVNDIVDAPKFENRKAFLRDSWRSW